MWSTLFLGYKFTHQLSLCFGIWFKTQPSRWAYHTRETEAGGAQVSGLPRRPYLKTKNLSCHGLQTYS